MFESSVICETFDHTHTFENHEHFQWDVTEWGTPSFDDVRGTLAGWVGTNHINTFKVVRWNESLSTFGRTGWDNAYENFQRDEEDRNISKFGGVGAQGT